MVWKIELDPQAEKELGKLDRQVTNRLLRFLFDRLRNVDDPRILGAALQGDKLNSLWKYRVGDYRIVAKIEDINITIIIIKIGHRKEVYR